MRLSYDGLWNMLSKLNVSKMDFAKSVGISNATLAKLGKDEPVALTILMRICEQYNCKIQNILEFIPYNQETFPDIETLNVGTILICECYPLGISVRTKSLSRRANLLNKQPCVVLRKIIKEGYHNPIRLLVAPLSYELLPNTLLNVKFKNLSLDDNSIIEHGYIQIDKIGIVTQNACENVLGKMPNEYLNESITLLEKLESIIDFENVRY